MVTSVKEKAVIGATSVALLAGAGGAYAATRSPAAPAKRSQVNIAAQRNAFLDDAAKRLGTTRAKLEAALKGAAADRVDAAVAAGRLTKAQGDALKQRIQSGKGPLLGLGPALRGRPGPGHRGFGFGFRLGFGPGRSLDAAATYLGMTDRHLRTQLRSGKSLAQLAKSKGKSLSGLEATIRSAVKARLDRMVANKRLTAAQRDEFLKRFDQALPSLVNGSLPAGPQFRHFGHP
jgi:hypothetical protein